MNRRGFTLLEIMIIVGIIGLLAAIAVPNFVRARQSGHSSTCANNLRQFQTAMEQYAFENSLANGNNFESSILNDYLVNLTANDSCPAGGTYSDLDCVGTLPQCSNHGSLPF